MPKRIVKTVIPSDGVFHFEATVRAEGNGGLRVAIPAPIVRGLVHLGWAGRWLDVKFGDESFKAAVRPHPTAVMFGLPIRHCREVHPGDQVTLAVLPTSGPRAPRRRRVRGSWRTTTATLMLPWLRGG